MLDIFMRINIYYRHVQVISLVCVQKQNKTILINRKIREKMRIIIIRMRVTIYLNYIFAVIMLKHKCSQVPKG
jgi:hypothetical protein